MESSLAANAEEFLVLHNFEVKILHQIEEIYSGNFDALVLTFRLDNATCLDYLQTISTPAIIVTGWTDRDTIKQLKSCPYPYLIHPFSFRELVCLLSYL